MEYKDLTVDIIREALEDVIKPQRTIKMYTGIGGFDLFEEAIENRLGYTRLCIGREGI